MVDRQYAQDGHYMELAQITEEYNQQLTPEKHLLVALLQRAILDLVSPHEEDRDEAKDWVLSTNSEDVPFSFKWTCSELGLNPTKVSTAIIDLDPRDDTISAQEWLGMRRHRH
ncbi:hypothetical protein JNK13_02450 [bacterium]|nr:hypothetical protein [bacterium]